MLRLVLDTNIVLDLVHWADSDAAPIMAALAGGQVACLADTGTLDELQRVLTYPQLGLTPEMAVDRYRRYAGLVHLVPALPRPCITPKRSPAVLFEAGVITNRDEELRLRDANYQTRIAFALTRAVDYCYGPTSSNAPDARRR